MAGAPFPGAANGFGYPNPAMAYPGADLRAGPFPGAFPGAEKDKPGSDTGGSLPTSHGGSAENLANAYGTGLGVRPAGTPAAADERELKRQRRKQSNRESARRSRLRKQAECEELGSRVGSLTEENEKLKTEVKRLTEQCQALSQDNTALRDCVVAAGGKVETEAPALPSGPTEEEKKMAAAAGAKAAAEAMEAAKKAAALAAGDSDEDTKSPEQGVKEDGGDDASK